MPLKHTDLVEKEVEGKIDHADDSITTEKIANEAITGPKLAPNIDAAAKNFNAKAANSFYCQIKTAMVNYSLNADEVKIGPVDLDYNYRYFFTLILGSRPTDLAGGLIIAGLARIADDKIRPFIKNIGTERITGVTLRVYEFRTLV